MLFYNSHNSPDEEYLLRKKEVVRVCEEWGVPMIDQDYLTETCNERVKGLEDQPEQGKRCYTCIGMRLGHAAREARERGFPIFGTTLTMGSRKSSKEIFPVGDSSAKRNSKTHAPL